MRRRANRQAVPRIAERCAHCALGPSWHDEPLTLHVDHVNGDQLDSRPENVRFLCPNCHSQTATYAGRNRRVAERPTPTQAVADPPADLADSAERKEAIAVIARFNDGELTAAQAAAQIGCHPDQIFVMRKHLRDEGSLTADARGPPETLNARQL